jgi:HSP20 family molecular chaperone IbpA
MSTRDQALSVQEKKEVTARSEATIPARFFTPAADIYETEEALTVVLEIPGVDKKDLEVHLENDLLKIEGRIDVSKYEGLEPLYSEYNVGHFARSFTVSNQVDGKRISAAVDNGVLTLTLPKAEESRPRRIPIG